MTLTSSSPPAPESTAMAPPAESPLADFAFHPVDDLVRGPARPARQLESSAFGRRSWLVNIYNYGHGRQFGSSTSRQTTISGVGKIGRTATRSFGKRRPVSVSGDGSGDNPTMPTSDLQRCREILEIGSVIDQRLGNHQARCSPLDAQSPKPLPSQNLAAARQTSHPSGGVDRRAPAEPL
jgi:hypothetical protein